MEGLVIGLDLYQNCHESAAAVVVVVTVKEGQDRWIKGCAGLPWAT